MHRNGVSDAAIKIDRAAANSFDDAADKLINWKAKALAGIDGNKLFPRCQGQGDLSID